MDRAMKRMLTVVLCVVMSFSTLLGIACDTQTGEQSYDAGHTAGFESGFSTGKEEGVDEGYLVGHEDGFEKGVLSGYEDGYLDGEADGYAAGKADGKKEGVTEGKASGYTEGEADGYAAGKQDGYTEGKADGYDEGKTDGYTEGYDEGKTDGYTEGKADGYTEGKTDGYADGYDEGKTDGYAEGYQDGKQDGDSADYNSGYADGYADGYAEGKKDGESSDYSDGYTEGKADGYTEGKTDGYTEGEAAGYEQGKADGYADGKTDGYIEGKADGYTEGKADGYDEGVQAERPLTIQFLSEGNLFHSLTLDKLNPPSVVLPTSTPVKSGYDFAGWFWDKDTWLKPLKGVDFLLYADISGTVTVHARFEQKTGIIINQVYGMGSNNNDDQAVSHSFVELYNTNNYAVSLQGFSLQASNAGIAWNKLDLSGAIPAKSSFLVVLTRYTNMSARLLISRYDLEWQDVFFSNKGIKVVLMKNTTLLSVPNPYDDGFGNRVQGYVDMIGVAGNDDGSVIDGYETDYLTGKSEGGGSKDGNSKQRSIRRINFADTDNNAVDCETIDFRTADLKYAPRSAQSGAWTSV